MSKIQSNHQLLRRLLKAARFMVQGGLSETTRRCGNRNCICHRDPAQRHGPHLYLTYRSEGKSCALYVPREHAEQARQAQAAWKEFWDVACALAAKNREQLREHMQEQAAPAKRRAANG
jgi:hypothetical protein